MTREEAKNIVTEIANKNKTIVWLLDTDIFKIIDMIYDDFESRTCENCKYFKKETDDFGFCEYTSKKETNSKNIFVVYKDFGCDRFKRTKNERD